MQVAVAAVLPGIRDQVWSCEQMVVSRVLKAGSHCERAGEIMAMRRMKSGPECYFAIFFRSFDLRYSLSKYLAISHSFFNRALNRPSFLHINLRVQS